MAEYRKVKSGLEISQSLAFYLEMSDPQNYPPGTRAATVSQINDILQGRAECSVEELLTEAERKGGLYYAGELKGVRKNVAEFLSQKAMLAQPYGKPPRSPYQYKTWYNHDDKPLKVINQRLFDLAVKAGFPTEFFQNSYFDHVTLYCLPDKAVLNSSIYEGCTFVTCRLVEMEAWEASFNGCTFHTCQFEGAIFAESALAYTHFHDCAMASTAFIRTTLRRCSTRDCKIGRLNLTGARLDGCSYDRNIFDENKRIIGLESVTITQGGATELECQTNRAAIFQGLGVADPAQEVPSSKPKGKKTGRRGRKGHEPR